MYRNIHRIIKSICLLPLLLGCLLVMTNAEDAPEETQSVTVHWEITEASVSIADGGYRWNPETLQYVREPLNTPYLSSTTPAEVVIRLESSGELDVKYTISYAEAEGITTDIESASPSSGTLTGENTAAVYESRIHILDIAVSAVQERDCFIIGTYTVSLQMVSTEPEEPQMLPEAPVEVEPEEKVPADEPAGENVPEEEEPLMEESASEAPEEEENPQYPEERELRIF